MNDQHYKSLIFNGPIGYVHLKHVYDDLGRLNDFLFVEVNEVFSNIVKKDQREIINQRFNDVNLGFNLDKKRFIESYNLYTSNKGYTITKYSRISGEHFTFSFFPFSKDDVAVYLTKCDFSSKVYGDPLIVEESKAVYYDVITGLSNRTYFDKVLKAMDNLNYYPLGIIICDINDMKQINSNFGRTTGDYVIQSVSEILRPYEDYGYVISRTGDDEFGIITPNTSNDVLYKLMLELQEKFQSIKHELFDSSFTLQVSLGYNIKKHETEDINAIIKVAEDYMMRRKFIAHKHSGKDGLASIKAMMVNNSNETDDHMNRMAELALLFAKKMEMKQSTTDDLYLLSMLHDIGKVGIPTHIITKPGPLTDAEWIEMKKHPMIGYDIAKASLDLHSIAEGILSHHERWDGKGYPQGLIGRQVPLLSRIVSIIDAYDAMTEDRPYRKKMTQQEALDEIIRCKGTQFDPDLVEVFLTLFE